jgi:hypothetical protein
VSDAALDRLTAAQAAHVAALDAGDIDGLESATAALRQALDEVRGQGGWRARADLRPRLIEARKQAEAARARVNWLADANARRLDRLANATNLPRAQAYGRTGRIG